MRVLITGANGFLGHRLVQYLGENQKYEELVLVDLSFPGSPANARVREVPGSVPIPKWEHVGLIFHLACIPGGYADQDFALGLQVNLTATASLLELARKQSSPPVFVYTSSVGVYGELPKLVENSTVARPTWSYGTHKLIGELLVADYTRKGFIDGRSIRLPAILARSADPSGAVSAFMSDLIREVSQGRPFICPVSPDAVSW